MPATTKSASIRRPSARATARDATVAFDRLDCGAADVLDAVLDVDVAIDRAELASQHALERYLGHLDQRHLAASLAGRCRHLRTDPAGADRHEPAARLRSARGGPASPRASAGRRPRRARRPVGAGVAAGRRCVNSSRSNSTRLAAGELEPRADRLERRHLGREAELDLLLVVEGLLVDERLLVGLAPQVVLRQRRPLVRPRRLRSDQHYSPIESLCAQGLGGLCAGEACANDDKRRFGHHVLPVRSLRRVLGGARRRSCSTSDHPRRSTSAAAQLQLSAMLPGCIAVTRCSRGERE